MRAIWTIGDLHLSLSAPEKHMGVFGAAWSDYEKKIADNWQQVIEDDDLVLIPGDICWAKHLHEALIDLAWLDRLPGTKVLIKGNHDYWWSSQEKMKKLLPPSIHTLYNNALHFPWEDGVVALSGSRLWDTAEYNFTPFICFKENPREEKKKIEQDLYLIQQEEIFTKELQRLTLSLKSMDPKALLKIALTHYPPIGADLAPSRTSHLLEQFGVDTCVFGHLHSIYQDTLPFGVARSVRYVFASADYISFQPIRLF